MDATRRAGRLVVAFKGLRERSAWCGRAPTRDVRPSRVGLVSKGKPDRFPPEREECREAEVVHVPADALANADGRVRLENQAVWVTGTK